MAMHTVFANSNPFCCSTWPGSGVIEVHGHSNCSTRQSKSAVALSGIRSISGRVEFGQVTRLHKGTRDVRVCGRRGRAGGRPAKTNRPNGTIFRGGGGSSLQQEQELQTKKTKQEEEDEDEALAEAALEALFAQLEKDLEDENMSEDDEDNEDFTEEEVMALEDELEAALLGVDYDPRTTTAGQTEAATPDAEHSAEDDRELLTNEEDEDEDEEQRVVSLERWQLKKLAAAVDIGRRHVNVKALASELGMDRSDVLAWLKNPPPELLMLGASMDLESEAEESEEDDADAEAPTVSSSKDSGSSTKQNAGSEGIAPVTWHSQKRLKKEHVATFERVFRRTRRPTNSMIQNLVELTHVPRKRIIEWFDQRRKEVDPSKSFESLR